MSNRGKIKTLLVFLIIVIVLSALVIFSFKGIGKDDNNLVDIAEDEVSEVLEEVESIAMDVVTEDEASKTLVTFNQHLFGFDFTRATEYIFNKTEGLELDMDIPIEREIEIKHQDVSIAEHFIGMKDQGNILTVKNLINTLKDEDVFLASTMWLDTVNRKSFIISSDSLNPVVDEGINVVKKEELDLESKELANVKAILKNIDKAFKYEFESEGNVLTALLVRNNDKLYIYKISEKEVGSTSYPTIREWDLFLSGETGYREDKIDEDNETFNEEILELLEGEEIEEAHELEDEELETEDEVHDNKEEDDLEEIIYGN